MKRNFAIALLALSTLAAAGKAIAQEPAVRATVPFDFIVGGKLLPADTYNIKSSSGVLVIRSADGNFSALATATYDGRDVQGGKLVFKRIGDRYFLHEVLCPAASMHASLATSRAEKQAQRQEAMLSAGQPVLVATR